MEYPALFCRDAIYLRSNTINLTRVWLAYGEAFQYAGFGGLYFCRTVFGADSFFEAVAVAGKAGGNTPDSKTKPTNTIQTR